MLRLPSTALALGVSGVLLFGWPSALSAVEGPAGRAQSRPGTSEPLAAEEDAADDGWVSGRYRLAPSDEIDLSFPLVPELDQTLVVQPDGYVTVRPVGEMRVQGRTVPQVRQMLLDAFAGTLREPVISIVLRDFERPFFMAAGELNAPGRFELRGALTVTQALAMAGGFKESAKHSQVILFRRYSGDLTEVKEVNVKQMLASKDLSEDPLLRPGDTMFVPRSLMSKLRPYIPTASLGFFLNPWQR